MSKNQKASGIINIISYDNSGNISFVSGSTTLMSISSSGAVTLTNTMSGGVATSASLSANSNLLQGTGSIGFATTASLLAVSSSQQQISASLLNVIANYATTGSNSFRANQSITGSLVVSSTITAQTLVVQTVTSSIVYSSGSNIFGSQLGNTQTFTGSIYQTGSIAAFAGSVGIGTNSPAYKLDVQGTGRFTDTLTGINAVFAQSNAASVNVNSTNTTSYSAFFFSENGTAKSYLEYINSAYTDASRRNYLEAYNVAGGFSVYTANVKALDINTSQVATFSGALNGASATFTGVLTATDGTQGLRVGAYFSGAGFGAIYSTGVTANESNFALAASSTQTFLNGTSNVFLSLNGAAFLTIASSGATFSGALNGTSATFNGNIASSGSNGFIGAYSTNPGNDTRIGAYWSDTSALEMRYNANSAVGYIQSLYPLVGSQPFGDIHFRQNVGGTMTTRMMIKNDGGSVGIGTSSPDAIFHVAKANSGGLGGQIVIDNPGGSTVGNNVEISFLTDNGASGAGIRNARIRAVNENAGNGAANMQFWTWNGGSDAERMRISSGGIVTKPFNPAFRAYYSVNNTWTLASGATFAFDTTEYNIGSCYNTSNGRFTAPVAGVYQFNFYTIVLGNYLNAVISFRKNGGAPTSGFNVHFSPYYTSTAWSNVVYTTALYLNEGDFVYMINAGESTNFHGDDWSSFSGYLVG